MTYVAAPQFESGPRVGLGYEAQLRVAAATLSRAEPHEITATTVVGVGIGADDLDRFRKLVAEIADEFDVEATMRIRLGSFSVRFTRPARATTASTRNGSKSMFSRIFHHGGDPASNGH